MSPSPTMPAASPSVSRPAPCLMPGLPGPLRPPTLLLVEDSRIAAESVRLLCRRAGLRLRRAETLAAATNHLQVYRPDIALVDLGLPDGSGLDLIDRLNRQVPRLGRILALSGDPTLEHAARRAGADGFIEKPLSLAAHLATILGTSVDPVTPADAAGWAPGPPGDASMAPSRNMGADPLALRDDLHHARRLLAAPAEPGRIGHAAQFLAGIARSLDDRPLLAQAERTRLSGEPAALLALLETRITAQGSLAL